MAKVYGDDEKAPGDRVFGPVERVIYRICRIDPKREQRWTVYAYSVIGFSIFSFLILYGLQRLQGHLPFNPTDVHRGHPAPVVQHRGQLHDQHELAVLRR